MRSVEGRKDAHTRSEAGGIVQYSMSCTSHLSHQIFLGIFVGKYAVAL